MFKPDDQQFIDEITKISKWYKLDLLSPEELMELNMASSYDLYHRQKGMSNQNLFKCRLQRCERCKELI